MGPPVRMSLATGLAQLDDISAPTFPTKLASPQGKSASKTFLPPALVGGNMGAELSKPAHRAEPGPRTAPRGLRQHDRVPAADTAFPNPGSQKMGRGKKRDLWGAHRPVFTSSPWKSGGSRRTQAARCRARRHAHASSPGAANSAFQPRGEHDARPSRAEEGIRRPDGSSRAGKQPRAAKIPWREKPAGTDPAACADLPSTAAARRHDRLQDVKESIPLRARALGELAAADVVGQREAFSAGLGKTKRLLMAGGHAARRRTDARTRLRRDSTARCRSSRAPEAGSILLF